MAETNKRPLTYRYSAVTDVGLRRTANQDSGYAGPQLLVVADGMGGAAAGDLASAEAMHVVRRLDAPFDGDVLEALAGAVHRANDRLAELIENDSAVEGMGTTLTAMLWDGERFGLAHIGDSRGYRLRDGELTQITTDHTFVQSLVDQGQITHADAHNHPHRNLILRVLVGSEDDEPDLNVVEPAIGDRYLLCSDGLSDMLDDKGIARALGEGTVDSAALALVQAAVDAGGVDNVTCVVAEVVDANAPADESLAGAAGDPILVGAAAEQARPRPVGAATTSTELSTEELGADDTAEHPAHDPGDPATQEERRYAPRPPRRHRWLIRAVVVLAVVAVIVVGARMAYGWSQNQYYVSESDGRVAIFRGVQANVPLVELESVYEVTEIDLSALPTFAQNRVRDGIESQDLDDARSDVQGLRDMAEKCADPKQASKPGSECAGVS